MTECKSGGMREWKRGGMSSDRVTSSERMSFFIRSVIMSPVRKIPKFHNFIISFSQPTHLSTIHFILYDIIISFNPHTTILHPITPYHHNPIPL